MTFVFVSVDPKRDTPEKIGEYVSAFDPRFYGVHVGSEALDALGGLADSRYRGHPPKFPRVFVSGNL